jgi:hypothetical protein
MPRYPKPDAERRNRTAPAFAWTELPREGRKGKPPALPAGREWPTATKAAWTALWAKPQATQWDQSGGTLHRWAWLHADLVLGKGAAASLSAEMRQIEDRHGLSPKAMLQLRWRMASDEVAEARAEKTAPARRARLKAVDPKAAGGGA